VPLAFANRWIAQDNMPVLSEQSRLALILFAHRLVTIIYGNQSIFGSSSCVDAALSHDSLSREANRQEKTCGCQLLGFSSLCWSHNLDNLENPANY
jgi:hypothetical protein